MSPDLRSKPAPAPAAAAASIDLDPWAEMMIDEPTAKFIGGVMPRAVTWRALDDDDRRVARAGFRDVLGDREGHRAVDRPPRSVDARRLAGHRSRLGAWCATCWGKGYATEGATAATDWAFDNLGWTDVIHSIDPANIASQEVAKRLGSRNLGRGQLPPPFQEARHRHLGPVPRRVARAPTLTIV